MNYPLPRPAASVSARCRLLYRSVVSAYTAALLLTTAAAVGAQDTVTPTTLASLNAVSGTTTGGTLTQDGDGGFYGTTFAGGTDNHGTVFRLNAAGALTTIHSFTSSEGSDPSTPLVKGTDGSFYGTLFNGGPSDASGSAGLGSVYRVTPDGIVTILYTFHAQDGRYPIVELLPTGDGGFYGALARGGSSGDGLLFKITQAGALTVLHQFNYNQDGSFPSGRLVRGGDGTIYGTTQAGGTHDGGFVYALAPDGTVRSIYQFTGGNDGGQPDQLIFGRDGNLYGLTVEALSGGNEHVDPIAFRLTTAGVLTTLHTFPQDSAGNLGSSSALVQANDGNLYGTTQGSGTNTGDDPDGSFFRLTTSGTFTSLYSFGGSGSAEPIRLLAGEDGNFYGVAYVGGTNQAGSIFKLSLTQRPSFFSGEVALSNGVYYLAFPENNNVFGYYAYLSDSRYVYHFDLGYEYVFDAQDGQGGVYFYDFASSTYFYTSPTFPFPYLYDFSLNTTLYYYPDPNNPGRYNTGGVRYFYRFDTGEVITK